MEVSGSVQIITDPDPGGPKTSGSGTLINTCVFFGRIRRGSPPTSSVSSSPVNSWRTGGPSPTTTSRRSPPCTSCCACAAGSLNPRSASSPRSTTATRQGWKKSVFFFFFFFFLTSPVVFLWVFWVFLYTVPIYLPRRESFYGFFSFKNTFRCIQTLNYNHSY
jgi:hypothetical protein